MPGQFEESVFPDEYTQIQIRRERAELEQLKSEQKPVPSVEHGLVGLALSGGGVRSALFNLGVLQAFSRQGLLRYVDYLSSVSGGGYVAGHLAKLSLKKVAGRDCHRILDNELNSHPASSNQAKQERIGNLERYLSDVLDLGARYLWPTVLNFAFYLSVIGILACLLAMFWRIFDHPDFRTYFELFNGVPAGDELLITFIPALLLLALWGFYVIFRVLTKLISHDLNKLFVRRPRLEESIRRPIYKRSLRFSVWLSRTITNRRMHQFFLFVLCASFVIGLVVFSSNGVTAIGRVDDWDQYWTFGSIALWLGLIAAALQILSVLGMKQLLRSGREHAPLWQKVARSVVSTACLVVGPLVMLHLMARDDISRFAAKRGPDLLRHDIRNDRSFCAFVGELQTGLHAESRVTPVSLASASKAADEVNTLRRDISGEDDLARWNNRILFTWRGTKNAAEHLFFVASTKNSTESDPIIVTFSKNKQELDTSLDNLLWQFNAELLPRPELTKVILTSAVARGRESPPERTEALSIANLSSNIVDFLKVLIGGKREFKIDEELLRAARPLVVERSRSIAEGELLGLRFGEAFPAHTGPNYTLEGLRREEIKELNRLLLDAFYPELIRPRRMNSTWIVATADQKVRLHWFATWAVLFLIVGGIIFLRRGKPKPIYSFYKDALIENFLRKGLPGYTPKATPVALSDLATCERGMPYHLFVAAGTQPDVFAMRPRIDWLPFLLSEKWCGYGGHYVRTQKCADKNRNQLSVADAVTLSGAAVTPWMAKNWGLIKIMWLFNLRLGRWLKLPFLKRHFLFSESVHVADGGFREYFGLEELLRRRCKVIIVSDAGCNTGTNELTALADCVRMMRKEHGIEFLDIDHDRPIDVNRIRRVEGVSGSVKRSGSESPSDYQWEQANESRIPQQIIAMRVHYPAKENSSKEEFGVLFYMQMALSGTEDVDLQQIRKEHPNFPDESTLNQFFTGEQSESYRQLGVHIGTKLCSEMPRPYVSARFSIRSLEDRLLVAYQQECFREELVDSNDVGPLLLMRASASIDDIDPQEGDSTVDGTNERIGRVDDIERLIRSFEKDAEFRRKERRQFLERIGASPDSNFGQQRSYEFSAARLPLIILCCHELVNGPLVPFRSRVFQVGGRRHFASEMFKMHPGAYAFFKDVRKFREGPSSNDHSKLMHLDFTWRKKLRYLISQQFFVEKGPETAVLVDELFDRGFIRTESLRKNMKRKQHVV